MIGPVRVISLVLVVAALSAADCKLPDGLKIVKPFVCEPGSHFKVDCNECTCSSEPGTLGMCTLMACNLEPDQCIPGSYFEIQGVLCKCPDSGIKWDSDCFASTR